MSEPLPVGEFKWVKREDVVKLDIMKVEDDAKYGFFLEVDLEYPPHLHDLHNDLPLAPEKIVIPNEALSPYQTNLLTNAYRSAKIPKLIPNFYKKESYVTHYRNLKYYLKMGMVLKKVHRVLSFRQEAWIRPYVSFNTEKRQQATSTSQKNFFKFLNNALFGRTMMNLRKQCNAVLTMDEKRAVNLMSKPNFVSFNLINDDLLVIQSTKNHIHWDKPTLSEQPY